MLLALLLLATPLAARDLGMMSLDDAVRASRSDAVHRQLFEPVELESSKAFEVKAFDADRIVRSQLLEDDERQSEGQWIGTGVALGLNTAAIGIGFGAWFDFYVMPYLAVSAYSNVSYGIVGRPYHNGGDALAFTFSVGAKFVLDFPNLEVTRWLRPFVAFYPLGFAYYTGTEDADEFGTGNTRDVTYKDLFFLMAGGIGTDFMLTHNIGFGVGFYIFGSIGGSKQKHSAGIETDTNGAVGVYIEYARLSLRF